MFHSKNEIIIIHKLSILLKYFNYEMMYLIHHNFKNMVHNNEANHLLIGWMRNGVTLTSTIEKMQQKMTFILPYISEIKDRY